MTSELGGEAPCWAHLIDELESTEHPPMLFVLRDLGAADPEGPDGVAWSLPHGGDLNANLVRLQAGGVIGEHANREVDVAITVVAGSGELRLDGERHRLAAPMFALVPRGVRREIRAGAEGLAYLSIHRRREPLAIRAKPTGAP